MEWQVLQVVLVSCVWFHLLGFQALVVWQLRQFTLVGTWVVGLPVAPVPLWQLLQVVLALNWLWSTLDTAQLLPVAWHFSQLPVTLACVLLLGLPTMSKFAPLRWQVAHCPLTALFAWNLPLLQALKPPLWQLSQLAEAMPLMPLVGMCLLCLPSAGGLLPVWQVAHWPEVLTWVWLKLVGFQLVTAWQLTQFADTGMCPEGLPLAGPPLWQPTQSVAVVNVL